MKAYGRGDDSNKATIKSLVDITKLMNRNIKHDYDTLIDFIYGNDIDEVIILGQSMNASPYHCNGIVNL